MTDPSSTRDIAAIARAAELMLHAPAIRREREALEGLLADDMVMFGTSGLEWSRAEFLESVVRFESSTAGFAVSEMVTQVVGDGIVLVRYLTTLGEWRSRRSSVWRVDDRGPQLIFHQGTNIHPPA